MPSLALLRERSGLQFHPCPKCSKPLILTRTKPVGIGYESRTFQGVHCEHVYRLETATESLKWISSGLRARI
jgi:hypothetical protein